MRVLVTGIAGFAGSYLAEELVSSGHEVCGTRLPGEALVNLSAIQDRIRLIACDVTSRADVLQAFEQARPEWVFHLAGQADVGDSYHNPGLTIDVNVKGATNVLEASRLGGGGGAPPRTVIVTSATVYGYLSEIDLPVTEETSLAPVDTYAVSKVACHYLGQAYYETYGVPVIEARPFNHIGPRQRPGFVVPDFASQIAAIMLGHREPVMRVGNLSSRRDFTDVRDVARRVSGFGGAGNAGPRVPHLFRKGARDPGDSGRAVGVGGMRDSG